MFGVGLPLFLASAPFSGLTYKGHGVVYKDAGPAATTMNYGTVTAGSSPAPGDLVVWVWYIGLEGYDTAPTFFDWRRQDLTGAGWVQSNQPAIPGPVDGSAFAMNVALAKVVSAADIASPPTIQPGTDPDFAANYGMWVAYSVTGTIRSLTIPAATRNYGAASAPASIVVDSSALDPPAVAITFVISVGSDGTIQIVGLTLDKEVSQADLGEYYTSTADIRAGVKVDVGGASYTISKGDDGNANLLFAGYVAVS